MNAPIYGKQAKEEDRSVGKTSFDIGVELTGKTYMTQIDDYQVYAETCSMYRDFETTYSDIALKAGRPYKLNIGYKVYANYEHLSPEFKGHKLGIEWIMRGEEELAITSLMQSSGTMLALIGSVLLATAF